MYVGLAAAPLGIYYGIESGVAAYEAYTEGDWVTGTKRLIDTVDIAAGFIGGRRVLKALAGPLKRAPKKVTDDFITVFRGHQADTTVIKSHAARVGGYAYSQRLIDQGNLDDLFRAHAANSRKPPSPFISVTTDRRVAKFFAGADGVVTELRIRIDRATPNRFNNLYVPAGPGGKWIPESELLVPNYIRPSEIIRRIRQ